MTVMLLQHLYSRLDCTMDRLPNCSRISIKTKQLIGNISLICRLLLISGYDLIHFKNNVCVGIKSVFNLDWAFSFCSMCENEKLPL